ncbi:MAG: hypothetical protein MUC66_06115 [Methanolinea sp.]|nr:hypothetical protein [Methanolinea sp.]
MHPLSCKKEPDTIIPSAECTPVSIFPFNQGTAIRERGDPPVNGRCESRMGEILLQFLLTHQVISHADPTVHTDFFRQFLAPFHIAVHEVDMHTLERTTLAGDEVVIGSFYLNFEREVSSGRERVVAQGLFTVRRNGNEAWVKFTSSTYQFKVHLQGLDLPSATVSQEGQITEVGPISLHPVHT